MLPKLAGWWLNVQCSRIFLQRQLSTRKCIPKIHLLVDQIYSPWLIHFVTWFN
jgi:hypothetical protein